MFCKRERLSVVCLATVGEHGVSWISAAGCCGLGLGTRLGSDRRHSAADSAEYTEWTRRGQREDVGKQSQLTCGRHGDSMRWWRAGGQMSSPSCNMPNAQSAKPRLFEDLPVIVRHLVSISPPDLRQRPPFRTSPKACIRRQKDDRKTGVNDPFLNHAGDKIQGRGRETSISLGQCKDEAQGV